MVIKVVLIGTFVRRSVHGFDARVVVLRSAVAAAAAAATAAATTVAEHGLQFRVFGQVVSGGENWRRRNKHDNFFRKPRVIRVKPIPLPLFGHSKCKYENGQHFMHIFFTFADRIPESISLVDRIISSSCLISFQLLLLLLLLLLLFLLPLLRDLHRFVFHGQN